MDAIVKMLEKHQPFFEKISRNIYLQAIKDGFLGCMPIVLTSSIFLLIATLPGVVGITLPQPLIDWCNKLYNFTMGVMGIMVAGTTAMLANAIKEGAAQTGENIASSAGAYGQHTAIMDQYDVIVLAPQVRSYYNDMKADTDRLGIKQLAPRGKEYIDLTRDPAGAIKWLRENLD